LSPEPADKGKGQSSGTNANSLEDNPEQNVATGSSSLNPQNVDPASAGQPKKQRTGNEAEDESVPVPLSDVMDMSDYSQRANQEPPGNLQGNDATIKVEDIPTIMIEDVPTMNVEDVPDTQQQKPPTNSKGVAPHSQNFERARINRDLYSKAVSPSTSRGCRKKGS
jgi:hypothetical protein